MPRELPHQLTNGPFTRSRAVDLGLTRATLRGKRFRRVRRGVYVTDCLTPSFVELFQAARLVLPPDVIAVSVTGLRLYGVEVGGQLPLRFASASPHPVRRDGIVVSRPKQLPIRSRGAQFVATPEHCFVSAAGAVNLLELVIAGDWLIRAKLTTRSRLVDQAAASKGPGVRLARRAASLVRDRVDSPRESRLRLCLVLAGLPTPDCNLTLGTEKWPIGRVDLSYGKYRVILEYEGDQHRTDRRQWNIDIARAEELTAEGYLVLRITAERMRRPRAVVLTTFEALRARGYSGPEPVFGQEWSHLFESLAA